MVKNFKRISIITLVLILLLNYIFSYTAFALTESSTLEDIIVEEPVVGGEYYKELKKEVMTQLRDKLESEYGYKGSVEELASACGIDLNDGTAGKTNSVNGVSLKIDDDTTITLGFNGMITTGAKSEYANTNNEFGSYTTFNLSNINIVKSQGEDNTSEKLKELEEMLGINTDNEVVVNRTNV